MSEPTRFGGHGMRGATLFIIPWTAMSLPHVLALAAGLGLRHIASRADEGVGCLFVLLAGGGMWLGWTLGEAWAGPAVGRHLGAIVGAALLPLLLVGVRTFLNRGEE